jgi:hypothetical protein
VLKRTSLEVSGGEGGRDVDNRKRKKGRRWKEKKRIRKDKNKIKREKHGGRKAIGLFGISSSAPYMQRALGLFPRQVTGCTAKLLVRVLSRNWQHLSAGSRVSRKPWSGGLADLLSQTKQQPFFSPSQRFRFSLDLMG